jgi:hypothetical protein
MTLILTYASDSLIVQVSDRLLTTSGRMFDTLANKSLVFLAQNAIVTMAYTGHAYLGGHDKPTDRYIAEALMGEMLEDISPGKPPMRFVIGPVSEWPTMGDVLASLTVKLTDAVQKLPVRERSLAPEIIIAGWQNTGTRQSARSRPLIASVFYSGEVGHYCVVQRHRRWHVSEDETRSGRACLIATPSNQMSRSEKLALVARLRDANSPDEIEESLVDAIREVSRKNSVVGSDCLSTLLSTPIISRARVRYLASQPTFHTSNRGTHPMPELPAAYTPWLVGPQLRLPPTILAGTDGGLLHEQSLGQYTVSFEYPNAPAVLGPIRGFILDTQTRRSR